MKVENPSTQLMSPTGRAAPWAVSDAPADFVQALLKGIVGVRLPISRIEGKFKLSQNHPAANRAGVIGGLTRRAQRDDLALVALMQAQEEGYA